jgi:hypothetical protein
VGIWLFRGAAVALSVLALTACLDPTDTPFRIRIENDQAVPVTAKLCKKTCDGILDTFHLEPGEGGTSGFHYRDSVPHWYVIQSEGGQTLGCVEIPVPDPSANSANIKVFTSQAVPCPLAAFPNGTPAAGPG